MDALLLERAETQQRLSLCSKDLERNKQQAKVKCNTWCRLFDVENVF